MVLLVNECQLVLVPYSEHLPHLLLIMCGCILSIHYNITRSTYNNSRMVDIFLVVKQCHQLNPNSTRVHLFIPMCITNAVNLVEGRVGFRRSYRTMNQSLNDKKVSDLRDQSWRHKLYYSWGQVVELWRRCLGFYFFS